MMDFPPFFPYDVFSCMRMAFQPVDAFRERTRPASPLRRKEIERMKRDRAGRMAGILAALFIVVPVLATATAAQAKTHRIAYIEAGDYWTYKGTLKAIQKAIDTPDNWKQIGWADQLEYPADAHMSPGWGKKEELAAAARELMGRNDIDLIVAAGTDAVDAVLKANNGKTPIVGIAVADAVKSKFVLSEKDSGVDNFTVHLEPGRYKRMFQIFHDVVGFKKLGLIYPNTESGRKYSSVEDARDVAQERGFEIIEYKKIGASETVEECMEGMKTLSAQGMDAFFVPTLLCFDWDQNNVKPLMDFLIEKKVPSFAREGSKVVQAGALMGFSTYDFSKRGMFISDKIIRILKGEKPRSLNMVDNAVPKISLNLKVAELIGFDPSFDIIAASDEIYQEITLPVKASQ